MKRRISGYNLAPSTIFRAVSELDRDWESAAVLCSAQESPLVLTYFSLTLGGMNRMTAFDKYSGG